MRTYKQTLRNQWTSISFIAAFLILLLSSCAQKINFLTSQVVPAARGHVQIKTDRNNNYVLTIVLDDLAEVKRLTPEKDTYIIWMNTAQNGTKNIGQLNSGNSTFSKKLKASFTTVTAFQPTRIFITAEDDANTVYPNDKIIVTTDNF